MLARVLGVYEIEKTNAIIHLLKPGSTFVDVGANVGDYSLLAARLVGDAGKVLCFEPERRNLDLLERGVDLNGYKNVEVYQVALSDNNGQATLHLGEIGGYHSLLGGLSSRQAGTVTVATRTLDAFLEESGRDRVDMMKIDVEGAEMQVLAGARATLEKNLDIVLFVEIHSQLGVNPAEVCDFLSQLGFSLFQTSAPFDKPLRVHDKLEELLARRK